MKSQITFYLTILILFCLSADTIAQQEISSRMKRDIEVAEDVLESLWKQHEENNSQLVVISGRSQKFEGVYMKDYGVIFSGSISGTSLARFPRNQNKNFSGTYWVDGQVQIYGLADKEEDDDDEDDDESESDEDEDFDEIDLYGDRESQFEDMALEFLGNYSSLLSQLKANEKITLRLEVKSNHPLVIFDGQRHRTDNRQKSFAATAIKKDMDEFRSGRLTEEQFAERIDFTREEDVKEKEPDLEILASVIHRLYKRDFSNSFSMRREPNYERLKDFGVIYHLDFTNGSQFAWGHNGETYTLRSKSGGRNGSDEIEENYIQLEKDLPEQIIEYGRLLKNLKKGEKLVFKASIPKCSKCEVPESLEYTVSQETLQAYNQNRMSLEQAIQAMTKATDNY